MLLRGGQSIFDNIKKDDLIFAFFPCIRFEDQILLSFRGEQWQDRNKSLEHKLERDIKLHNELNELYKLVTELVLVCIRKELRLVIENPYSTQHYLQRYWCLKPKIIDKDRTVHGDYFKKPTQFYFVNYEPSFNLILEEQKYNKLDTTIENVSSNKLKGLVPNKKVARSMIHPDYASRFIREYIL